MVPVENTLGAIVDECRRQRETLDMLIDEAARARAQGDLEQAIEVLERAASWALKNFTGVFLDRRLETLMQQMADQLNGDWSPACAGDRVGIMMSGIYGFGGHSRIAWRWMQLDQQSNFVLLLTRQAGSDMPEELAALEGCGRLQCLSIPPGARLARILRMRDELAGMRTLVINLHPDDIEGAIVVACLRAWVPAVFIDHAYFSFSVGMASARTLCVTNAAAASIAVEQRLVSPEHLLWYVNSPEPVTDSLSDSLCLRRELGIPDDALMLLTAGSAYKYRPLDDLDFLDLVGPEVAARPNVFLVMLGSYSGMDFLSPVWRERLGERLKLCKPVGEREFRRFIAATDIYLDAVPFHSGGGAMQAMLAGKPTLQYAAPAVYLAKLAPQRFALDDFSLFHFSPVSYRVRLGQLLDSPAERQILGQRLQVRLGAQVNEQANLLSIHDAYARVQVAPLIGETLLSPDMQVSNPALLRVHSQLTRNAQAGVKKPILELVSKGPRAESVLRAIAFHLPQFHTIAENNRWWGEGFTEWTNVRQGKPLFEGHNQPCEPGELGYYDLSNPQALARQAALAREYGLEGFCFYYYWFDGKRLLEKPVDQLLQHPEINLPFCLCWANENWTRRWDGGEQEVLMRQSYSPELNERFAVDLLPYMRDPRYIRIDGKPVFLVYRSDIIPDLPGTLKAWRDTWRAHGLGEVYLIGVESFRVFSPAQSGFDATCEFLPHQVDLHQLGPDNAPNLVADPAANVGDYSKLSEYWLKRPRAPYKRFRGLVPSWDNAARRRKGGATLFVDSSPQLYQRWLERTAAKTLIEFQGEERIVFINAWNEWGEGCYLEPDQRHGRAYLESTRAVLQSNEDDLLALLPLNERLGNAVYQCWMDANVLAPRQLLQLSEKVAELAETRLIVVVLVRPGDELTLSATLESLQAQHSQADEIWLFGEASGQLQQLAIRHQGPLRHWMQALNSHLGQPNDWFVVLYAGDRLADHACLLLRAYLQQQSQLQVCYFDEDWQLPMGGSAKPVFKPDFNLDMLRSFPYTGHALALRSGALAELGGLEDSYGELALQDLLFRAVESSGFMAVGHLPEVILHAAEAFESWLARPEIASMAGLVTAQHLQRLGVEHQIEQGHLPGFNRVRYLPTAQPLVSIVVPTKDQLPMLQRCLESIIERTRYARYELLVIDNASETPEARSYLAGLAGLGSEQIRVLSYPHPFNYAAINNFAVTQARGELTLLLNNDTAVLHADWLDTLVSLALRPEVGLVGPKLLYPDGTVQHGGVVLGLRGPADHPFLGMERDAPGYMHRLQVEQNYSALTAACLMIPTQLYHELGGMDEEAFKVSYNDVDLCLKVREAGYLAVWTPHVCLLHEGSVSQRQVDRTAQEAKRVRFVAEQDAFYARWHEQIGHDPAYNKNLSLNAAGFEFESDVALTWRPLHWRPEPVVLAHPADHAGCGHYRIIQPFEALQAAGLVDGMLSDGLLSVSDLERYAPDAIVLQRQIGEERLEAMRRIKAFSSAFKVYELDDYLPNLPLKSLHRTHMSKDILRTIRRGCSYVDRFVVSTDALAEAFAGIHPDIRVVPNRLPAGWWRGLSNHRRQGVRPRVGWAGGVSHSGDLDLIADVVRELAGEVEWVFFGMCPDKLRPYVSEFYAGVAIERYPRRLAALGLDLALAPVEQNLFNECKSNLRLLEYGACGFPVICSDVGCYRSDLPVTRVKNRFKDWVDAIRMHINDLDEAARLGDQLHERVMTKWMLEGESLEQWRSAWTQG